MNKKQKEWISKNIEMPSALVETTIPMIQLELLRSTYQYLIWTYHQTDESFIPRLTGPELIRDIRLFLSSYASRIEACLIACDGIPTETLRSDYGNQGSMSPKDIKDIAEWLVGDDYGVSSKTMAAIALGADKGRFNAPHDPSDFGRCSRLVKKVPAIRTAFDRIGKLEPRFAGILLNWDELCAIYERDLHTGQSKELYRRIKELRGDAL